jgi:hypothetical protein
MCRESGPFRNGWALATMNWICTVEPLLISFVNPLQTLYRAHVS